MVSAETLLLGFVPAAMFFMAFSSHQEIVSNYFSGASSAKHNLFN